MDNTSVQCLFLVAFALTTLTNAQPFRDHDRIRERDNAFQEDNFRRNNPSLNEQGPVPGGGSKSGGGPTAFGNTVRKLLMNEFDRQGLQPNYAGAQQAELVRFFEFGDNMTVHVFKGKPMEFGNNAFNNALNQALYPDDGPSSNPLSNEGKNRHTFSGAKPLVQKSYSSKKQSKNVLNNARDQLPYSNYGSNYPTLPKKQYKNPFQGDQEEILHLNYATATPKPTFPQRQNKNSFNGGRYEGRYPNYDSSYPAFPKRQNKDAFNGAQSSSNYDRPNLAALTKQLKQSQNTFNGNGLQSKEPSSNYGAPSLSAFTSKKNKNIFSKIQSQVPYTYDLSSIPFGEKQNQSSLASALAKMFPSFSKYGYGSPSSPPPFTDKQNESSEFKVGRGEESLSNYRPTKTPLSTKRPRNFGSGRQHTSKTKTTTPPPLDDYDYDSDYDYSDKFETPQMPKAVSSNKKKPKTTHVSLNSALRSRDYGGYDRKPSTLRQELESMTMANGNTGGQPYRVLRYIPIQSQQTLPLQVPARFMMPPPAFSI